MEIASIFKMSGNEPTKTQHHLPKMLTRLTFILAGLPYQAQQMVILEQGFP
jgi:hypothetical protein